MPHLRLPRRADWKNLCLNQPKLPCHFREVPKFAALAAAPKGGLEKSLFESAEAAMSFQRGK